MSLISFFYTQLEQWKLAKQNYERLKEAQIKRFFYRENEFLLQFNPHRISSASANVSAKAISERPCFLCKTNRPKEQITIPQGEYFEFLVNPFPILPIHFTIASLHHQAQNVKDYYDEFYSILNKYSSLTVFYNGAKCGASAPDHLHLQAFDGRLLPIQKQWNKLKEHIRVAIQIKDKALIGCIDCFIVPIIIIKGIDGKALNDCFTVVYRAMQDVLHTTDEPMMNIVSWKDAEEMVSIIFPRAKHRPQCYGTETAEQCLISPGALDMAGWVVSSREEDFNKLTEKALVDILKECALSNEKVELIMQRITEKADKEMYVKGENV